MADTKSRNFEEELGEEEEEDEEFMCSWKDFERFLLFISV